MDTKTVTPDQLMKRLEELSDDLTNEGKAELPLEEFLDSRRLCKDMISALVVVNELDSSDHEVTFDSEGNAFVVTLTNSTLATSEA